LDADPWLSSAIKRSGRYTLTPDVMVYWIVCYLSRRTMAESSATAREESMAERPVTKKGALVPDAFAALLGVSLGRYYGIYGSIAKWAE
jgi:hypothetical protein